MFALTLACAGDASLSGNPVVLFGGTGGRGMRKSSRVLPDKNRDRPLRRHSASIPVSFHLNNKVHSIFRGRRNRIGSASWANAEWNLACLCDVRRCQHLNIPTGSRKECSMTGLLGAPVRMLRNLFNYAFLYLSHESESAAVNGKVPRLGMQPIFRASRVDRTSKSIVSPFGGL